MGVGRIQKEGLVEDLTTGRVWRLTADEGKYPRGTGLAPAPLMHWAAGLHGGVTSRIAGLAAAEKVTLASLEVTVSQGSPHKDLSPGVGPWGWYSTSHGSAESSRTSL